MVTPSVGLVVLIPFPFSDLSQSKLRPAVVVADAGRDDWILCQVTSNPYSDSGAVQLTSKNFQSGTLQVTSYVRPGKLFTASQKLMTVQVGKLTDETLNDIVSSIVNILHAGLK